MKVFQNQEFQNHLELYKEDEQVEIKESIEEDNDAIVPNDEMIASLSEEEDGMSLVGEDGELTNEELNQGNGDYDSYELSDEE